MDEFAGSLPADRTLPIDCDISDPKAVEAAVKKVRETWGTVDVLVNNAGIFSNNKAVGTSPEEWKKIYSVNLDGALVSGSLLLTGKRG